jgi:CheY-like chemotaxis protein
MGFEVVGEAVDAYEGLAMVRTLQPRLVTLDLFMPVVGGVDSKVLFRMIREENPEIGIVVISGHRSGESELPSLAAASPARPGGGSMKKVARSRRCPATTIWKVPRRIKAGMNSDLDGPLFRTAAGVIWS